jgi:hypothetical protein
VPDIVTVNAPVREALVALNDVNAPVLGVVAPMGMLLIDPPVRVAVPAKKLLANHDPAAAL